MEMIAQIIKKSQALTHYIEGMCVCQLDAAHQLHAVLRQCACLVRQVNPAHAPAAAAAESVALLASFIFQMPPTQIRVYT